MSPSSALKRHWQGFLGRYVATRQSLVGLVLIVDARHGLAELDVELLSSYLGSGRPVLLLATKMDKLTTSRQRIAEQDIVRALVEAFPMQAAQVIVIPFSATNRLGLETLMMVCPSDGRSLPTRVLEPSCEKCTTFVQRPSG